MSHGDTMQQVYWSDQGVLYRRSNGLAKGEWNDLNGLVKADGLNGLNVLNGPNSPAKVNGSIGLVQAIRIERSGWGERVEWIEWIEWIGQAIRSIFSSRTNIKALDGY